jgi:hypothetical protein
MPTDTELLEKLLQSTQSGRIDWEKTAVDDQYSASFGGKWTVLIDRSTKDRDFYWLTLRNANGDELLEVNSMQDIRVPEIFFAAKRRALKVDEALADVIKDLDKPIK